MELPILNFGQGRYRLEAMAMPRGEYHLDVIGPGEAYAYFLLRGKLNVSLQGRARPMQQIHATPGSPVILVTPGAYHICAADNCVGFRGVRRV